MQIKTLYKIFVAIQYLGYSVGMSQPRDPPTNRIAPVQHCLAYAGETGMVVS